MPGFASTASTAAASCLPYPRASSTEYGAIVSWFSFAYGFGMLVMGRVLDRIGVRKGFSLSIVVWSLAAMGHALARSVAGFGAARALLGVPSPPDGGRGAPA